LLLLDLEQNLNLEALLLTFNIQINPLALFQKRIGSLVLLKTSLSLKVSLVKMLLMLQHRLMESLMVMVEQFLVLLMANYQWKTV
jgi:hypothetical protein